MAVTVTVEQKGAQTYRVKISSDCDMLLRLGQEVSELRLRDAFRKIVDNPVYQSSSACLQHISCPVPSGILKALEVEAGVAVAENVEMKFQKNNR